MNPCPHGHDHIACLDCAKAERDAALAELERMKVVAAPDPRAVRYLFALHALRDEYRKAPGEYVWSIRVIDEALDEHPKAT